MSYQRIKNDKNISVIIPVYNGVKYLKKCFDSLYNQIYKKFEIIVVDNNSGDGSVEYIKNNYPRIKIIENKKNLGFARANNIGIKEALKKGAEVIVIISQDNYFETNFLYEGLKILEIKEVGVCTPKIIYAGTNIIWWAGGKFLTTKDLLRKFTVKITEHIGKKEKDLGQYNKIREVDVLTGNTLFIKREVFEKIGLFDEKYFLYGDDVDFSLRVKEAGFKLLYFPSTKVYHMTPLKSFKKRTPWSLFLKYKRYMRGLLTNVNRYLIWYQKLIWYFKLPLAVIITLLRKD